MFLVSIIGTDMLCGERRECLPGFRGISWRIPGNVIVLTFQVVLSKNSGECSRTFREMLKNILGNVQEHFGEC